MCNQANCIHGDDDLNDDLGFWADMGRETPAGEPTPVPALPVITTAEPALYEEKCMKCGGSGRFVRGYSFVGQCFACKGKGKLVFKQSPEARAAQAASRQNAKQKSAEEKSARIDEWLQEHKVEFDWMTAAAMRGFGFASSMIEALAKYGHLTEKQLETVRRCAANDEAREARLAAERLQRETSAKEVSIAAIAEAFDHAKGRGVNRPKLRLDTFVFSPAGDTSPNAGAIYVKEDDEYLGKIVEGKFIRVRACTPDQEERIIIAAADPGVAATAYGQRTGCCSVCGRKLTAKESVDRAIGPICLENYGF